MKKNDFREPPCMHAKTSKKCYFTKSNLIDSPILEEKMRQILLDPRSIKLSRRIRLGLFFRDTIHIPHRPCPGCNVHQCTSHFQSISLTITPTRSADEGRGGEVWWKASKQIPALAMGLSISQGAVTSTKSTHFFVERISSLKE